MFQDALKKKSIKNDSCYREASVHHMVCKYQIHIRDTANNMVIGHCLVSIYTFRLYGMSEE